ncbi:MAG: histidinol dehydrogenase, partial [Hyphomicrobiales bacterium]
MTIDYLKKADRKSTDDAGDVNATVKAILDEIEAGSDEAARRYAAKFDKYDGNVVLTRDEIEAASEKVSQKLKDDIRYAWDNVRTFAEAQKASIKDIEVELRPGLIAGQKAIPCQAAGCYA